MSILISEIIYDFHKIKSLTSDLVKVENVDEFKKINNKIEVLEQSLMLRIDDFFINAVNLNNARYFNNKLSGILKGMMNDIKEEYEEHAQGCTNAFNFYILRYYNYKQDSKDRTPYIFEKYTLEKELNKSAIPAGEKYFFHYIIVQYMFALRLYVFFLIYKYLESSYSTFTNEEVKNIDFEWDFSMNYISSIGFNLSTKKSISNSQKEELLLDYSHTSVNEKIVILHKVGILDKLKENPLFATSTNRLAEFLSSITGDKTTTIQSYLNPIYSPNVDQSKNPLTKDKLVEKAKLKLLNMGMQDEDLIT